MESLKQEIRTLHQISATLEPNQDQRDQMLAKVHQFSNEFLNALPFTKAFSDRGVTDGSL